MNGHEAGQMSLLLRSVRHGGHETRAFGCTLGIGNIIECVVRLLIQGKHLHDDGIPHQHGLTAHFLCRRKDAGSRFLLQKSAKAGIL